MLKHIRDCTVAEDHHVKEEKIWDMIVKELKAFIGLIHLWQSMDLATFGQPSGAVVFQRDHVPKQISGNQAVPAFRQKGKPDTQACETTSSLL